MNNCLLHEVEPRAINNVHALNTIHTLRVHYARAAANLN